METIDDILREMRTLGQLDEKSTDKIPRSLQALGLRTYADRIEQAVVNCNQLKMRNALECIDSIAKYLEAGTIRDTLHAYRNIQDRVKIALSTPPRNCDVGGASEQSVRMAKFCREQYKKTDGVSLCSGCQFHNIEGLDCQFAWSQMPYKSEVKR